MSTNTINSYAGFWQRVRAFVFDYVIILFYLLAITVLFLLLNSFFRLNDLLFSERARAQFFAFILVTLPVTLYFAFNESSIQQATWGKKRLSLQVVNANGGRISLWRSLARTLMKFIPWELSFSPRTNTVLIYYGFGLVYLLIGLNIASLVMTKKHQTIYELLTKTYVVKRAS